MSEREYEGMGSLLKALAMKSDEKGKE